MDDETRRPRVFAPGETVGDDDFRQFVIMELWFATHAESREVEARHEHDPMERPFARMSRERIYELMSRAALAGDAARWFRLAEHFRDRMSVEELGRDTRAALHAVGVIKDMKLTGDECIRAAIDAYDFVTLVEG